MMIPTCLWTYSHATFSEAHMSLDHHDSQTVIQRKQFCCLWKADVQLFNLQTIAMILKGGPVVLPIQCQIFVRHRAVIWSLVGWTLRLTTDFEICGSSLGLCILIAV